MSDALVQVPEVDATPVQSVGIFGGSSPVETVRKATEVANALADVIRSKHLYKTIGAKNHVLVEAWTLCGTMLGVFPVCVWTKKIEGGWEARVEARTLSGAVVGAAEASCMEAERNWKGRDDYAIRSMAQTRATGKAMRIPLGFVVVLAGYEATPAEEMPKGEAVEPDLTPLLEQSIAELKKPIRCKECHEETAIYKSTQAAHLGREYRQCKWAHDTIMDDMAQGVPLQTAHAAVSKHTREWVGSPPRKVPATKGAAPEAGDGPITEAKPTEPAPSMFDPEAIAADVAARLAKERT